MGMFLFLAWATYAGICIYCLSICDKHSIWNTKNWRKNWKL